MHDQFSTKSICSVKGLYLYTSASPGLQDQDEDLEIFDNSIGCLGVDFGDITLHFIWLDHFYDFLVMEEFPRTLGFETFHSAVHFGRVCLPNK
ncbi:hypothetical protein SUGI_0963510 [Cryptomeria japonica]|nr:hypothetical protein SUGI_0963510 [Cryptomeria japonica]